MAGSTLVCASVVAAAMATSAVASGSPLEDTSLGGAVFTGVTQAHASSIQINPAALGLAGPGWHLYLGGSLRFDRANIDRRLIDIQTGAQSAGPSSKTTTLSPSGMLAAYWKSSSAAIGLATYTPQAERFIANQEALRYYTLGGHQYLWTVLAVSASFRWKKFWFGVTVGLGNMQSLRLQFARDTALEAGSAGLETDCGNGPCGVENDAAAQRYDVEVASKGLNPFNLADFLLSVFASENISLNVGTIWQPIAGWVVGLSYQGSAGLLGSSRRNTGTVRVTGSDLEGNIVRVGEAEIAYSSAETVTLGLRMPFPGNDDFDALGSVRWQNTSVDRSFDLRMFGKELQGQDIPEQYPLYRGFSDLFRVEIGIERRAQANFRFGGRLFLERGAVDANEMTPLTIAGKNMGIVMGAEVRLGPSLVLGAGYGLTWFPTVDTGATLFDPRDRVACVDSGFDIDACDAAREGRARPSAAGSYGRLQHAVTASLRWDFL